MLLTAFEWPFTQYRWADAKINTSFRGNVFREPREEQQKFAFVRWKTYDRFFFSPLLFFHVSDSEIVSGDNFFDALDNGVVVCRLARVIQEKARTAIDAGRAKGVSNSLVKWALSTIENWIRMWIGIGSKCSAILFDLFFLSIFWLVLLYSCIFF